MAQVFLCEFCEILRTLIFTEHPWTNSSDGVFCEIGVQQGRQGRQLFSQRRFIIDIW